MRKPITDISQLDLNKKYTYADYLLWQLKVRIELIKGKIFRMSPAPSVLHSRISGDLFREISVLLKNRPCQVFHPPFDVRIPRESNNDEQIYTVLQPDITIVCNLEKLDQRGCIGPPDLVVEILSPSTADKDLHEKYDIYQEAGVKEYWIVVPGDQIVHVFVLEENGKFRSEKPKTRMDKIRSLTIPELEIQLKEIFPSNIQEPEEPCHKEIRIDP